METTHPVTVAVPAAVFAALVREAKRDRKTLAEWLVWASEQQLKHRRPPAERHQAAQECLSCWQVRRLHARGRCRPCYYREYEAARLTHCAECKRWRRFVSSEGRLLCRACYMRAYRRRTHRKQEVA